MRIVFTSCCDTVHDGAQAAWDAVRALAPQHIVLLGDNIYMDYKLSRRHLNDRQVRKLPPAEFAQMMHGRYARQWQVPGFRQAIAGAQVHAIWDDHDFAWNDSRGAGADDGRSFVPADRRRISRVLFQQFRDTLAAKPVSYPALPFTHPSTLPDLGSIHTDAKLRADVRLHLLDGRSFRDGDGDLLGKDQRNDVEGRWLPPPCLNLVASGGTLLDDWHKTRDLEWLRTQARTHRILVLSGDAHELRFADDLGIPDATASAMAQPKFSWWFNKRTDAFGVLDIGTERLRLSLRVRDKLHLEREIDLMHWPY